MPARPPATVTVRELLACPPLATEALVGGGAGLDTVVESVGVCDVSASVDLASAGSLLVLDPRRFRVGSLDVELVLRKARSRRVACVVAAAAQGPVPASTVRLADKLGIPLVGITYADSGTIAHRVSELVHQPRLAQADAVSATVAAIWAAGGTVDGILQAVTRGTAGRCCVVGVDGSVIAGVDFGVDLSRLLAAAPQQRDLSGLRYTMVPVPLEPPLDSTFWLVTEERVATADRGLTKPVLEVAVWALASRLANDRLTRERDVRSRSALLAELKDASEPVGQHVLGRAALIGWRLQGWHTAAHIATLEPEPPERFLALTEDLEAVLRHHGMSGVVVPIPEGWTLWRTTSEEPDPASRRDLVTSLERALQGIQAAHPSLQLCAGVGRAQRGLTGIGRSLAESRQAMLLARAARARGRVEDIDDLGVKPLLVGWCNAPAFEELARTLLAPALDAEGGEDLFRTLDCYLDQESSVGATAALLKVHRNTVAARVERLRVLLSLDLQHPDERLVLRLACRAIRFRRNAER